MLLGFSGSSGEVSGIFGRAGLSGEECRSGARIKKSGGVARTGDTGGTWAGCSSSSCLTLTCPMGRSALPGDASPRLPLLPRRPPLPPEAALVARLAQGRPERGKTGAGRLAHGKKSNSV